MSRVQIVGISEKDAHFPDKAKFLGSHGEFEQVVTDNVPVGFVAGHYIQDNTNHTNRLFLAVLVEEEEP